jgi:hypothetical protein
MGIVQDLRLGFVEPGGVRSALPAGSKNEKNEYSRDQIVCGISQFCWSKQFQAFQFHFISGGAAHLRNNRGIEVS